MTPGLPIAAIERLPIDIPTDFIVGTAGLGGVVAFAAGVALRIARAQLGELPIDPVHHAGWGAGMMGVVAVSAWVISSLLDVSFR